MDKDRLKILLEKYEQQTLDPEEAIELDIWYQSFDAKPGTSNSIFESKGSKEAIKNQLFEKIAIEAGIYGRPKPNYNMKWAAVIAFCLISSVLLLIWQKQALITKIELTFNETVTVPSGKLLKKDLPDGSQVWLNAGSKLIYSRLFLGGERKVYLEGEGYFKVAKDPDKPFIVHSQDLKTQVLGTSFVVKSLKDLDIFEVVVRTGKVQVSDNARILAVLQPSQKIVRIGHGGYLKEEVNNEHYLSWTNGGLYVENQSLEEIGWRLEQRFGQKIIIQDSILKALRFTGNLTGLSVEQAFQLMKEIHPFETHFDKDNRLIVGY